MKKPAIPFVTVSDAELASILRPMKENIEVLTGIRVGRIETLQSTATLSDVIAKLNEVINRLNA